MTNEHEKRLTELQRCQKEMEKAFVKNDLGEPSFDAHRLEHIRATKQSEQMELYKSGMTKTLLDWLVKGLIGVFVAGAASILANNFLDKS